MDEPRPSLEFTPDMLRRRTDPTRLPFQTTASLPPPAAIMGQERAHEAMVLALEVPDAHYNLYVAGRPGTGRTRATMALVRAVASQRRPQLDWVYVYNFERPEEPLALELPAGRGSGFARDVEHYITACRRELRRAFSAEVYTQRLDERLADLLARREHLLEALQSDARALGMIVRGTPSGFVIDPLVFPPDDAPPVPMVQEVFDALPDDQKQQLRAKHAKVEAAVARILPDIRAIEAEAREVVHSLDRDVADQAVRHFSELIAGTYAAYPAVQEYLKRLRTDVVTHAHTLRGASAEGDDDSSPMSQDAASQDSDGLPMDDDLRDPPSLASLLRRYGVNVMVSHQRDATAPVVEETNPTYANLMGRIDQSTMPGGLTYTDHMMLKPGAMHKAVGGFLVLQAHDMTTIPRCWEAVKRLVRFGRIELENGSEADGRYPAATIRPQPIRADVKVIMIGDAHTYNLLADGDAEFRQWFKVRAEFDSEMPRSEEAEMAYAQLAGEAATTLGYPAFTSEAVALVIEEGSRWAEDQERLSAQFDDVRDLCVEAGFFARRAGDALTRSQHVATAIRARDHRDDLLQEQVDREILQQRKLISTEGKAVGQVNGLGIYVLRDYEFGFPSRITATVSPGLAGVVTVEREADMSDPTHTKGVLILSGYLAGRFAEDFPLSLSASLTLEQNYGGVEGDSASSAELYALLSALSGVGIRQSLAVTGSVNQRGEAQAIGGATYKIEGFFRICQQRGLTGEHGVIIPRANLRSLMLRDEVVEAVRLGKFHIYGVDTIEEGISLLTGIPFGTKTSEGQYLEGTIAARVLRRLRDYSELVRYYAGPFSPGAPKA